MSLDVFIRGIILIPACIAFLYLLLEVSSEFSKALKNCDKPILVRSFPPFILINFFFSREGIFHRNRMLRSLFLSLCILGAAVLSVLFIEGNN